MIGFENFSVSSWFDSNVLTRHIAVEKKEKSISSQKWKGAVMASSLVLGLNFLTTVAVAEPAPIFLIKQSRGSDSRLHPKLGELVPDGYWSKLLVEMKSWEKLPEPNIIYPDED
ncbi:hypothetical protein [Collimonas fungivorans]|uniref:hypothetical protein n=1 Tax=Collimonas fungivorans TaxID=158899 RepID=UPI00077852D2|nr:hypothetical protein [Collimonas fungivorans]